MESIYSSDVLVGSELNYLVFISPATTSVPIMRKRLRFCEVLELNLINSVSSLALHFLHIPAVDAVLGIIWIFDVVSWAINTPTGLEEELTSATSISNALLVSFTEGSDFSEVKWCTSYGSDLNALTKDWSSARNCIPSSFNSGWRYRSAGYAIDFNRGVSKSGTPAISSVLELDALN